MDRLIERFPLQRGAHPSRDDGMCAMEMVAWLAGEPHSDEPQCACPVLAAFVRACNDAMPEAARNCYLRPLVPTLVNTRASMAVERARGFLVLDCMVRQLVPAWLARHHWRGEAAALESLGPIVDAESLAPAASLLEHLTADLRAARWVVLRAQEGMPPARYVAGAIQVARALGDDDTWSEVARAIQAMADLQPHSRPGLVDNPAAPDSWAE